MIAGLYEHLAAGADTQADKIAAFVDAQRLAYADRDHFFGDPDAIDIPLQELLYPAYIQHRASQRFEPAATPSHGNPLVNGLVNFSPIPEGYGANDGFYLVKACGGQADGVPQDGCRHILVESKYFLTPGLVTAGMAFLDY